MRAFARETLPRRGATLTDERRAQLDTALTRFRKRLAEVGEIDFFAAPGRETVDGLLADLEERLAPRPGARDAPRGGTRRLADVQGRTWVTRAGVHVDRMASAWLIGRFLDARARFKFVPARGYQPAPDELRFDMFDAEFTHQGEL